MQSSWHSGVLDPQGPVAAAERTIIFNASLIMLAVIVPIMVAIIVLAWWFRAGNTKAPRLPDWSYSGRVELVVWSVPALIVVFLSGVAWIGTHDVDPRKPLAGAEAPIHIQVISMDWKWLFIYPDQGIASINQLVIPIATPIRFSLTSASVMNSFFVPQLGSQIYTMAGMQTELNLQADRPGQFPGFSAQFSGAGFSDMRFNVAAVSKEDFAAWLKDAHSGGGALDIAAYQKLLQERQAAVPNTLGVTTPGIFEVAMATARRETGDTPDSPVVVP